MSSRPSNRALPRVAIFSQSYPLGALSLEWRRWSRKAARSSSRRLDPSLLALPSTARPTGMSRESISGTRHTPEESFMLEMGQWATPAPVSARSCNSSSLKWMPWAYQTSGPTQPRSSM